MKQHESFTETILGVGIIVFIFCLFFTYAGQAALKEFLRLLY